MSTLVVIPARKGSKGLVGKNVKPLSGKPLIEYSLDFAKSIVGLDDQICISSNDELVLSVARKKGIELSFVRPENLSGDRSSMFDVLIHAVDFYEGLGCFFDKILLLQPTSPFRQREDFDNLIRVYSEDDCDMVVSVVRAKENPYFTLFEQEPNGFLRKSKPGDFVRRQDCPDVYSLNGSMYLINVVSLRQTGSLAFDKIKMMEMPKERSVDIDDINDFRYAEYIMNTKA